MISAAPAIRVVTADAPGAIGIIQLTGPGATDLAERLTGVTPSRRCRLVRFEDIDEGLVVALREAWCQLLPHGGPRVIRRLVDRLIELGGEPAEDRDSPEAYPEADSPLEADMLATLARAASPAAIDLLLDQPAIWRDRFDRGQPVGQIAESTSPLDHLIHPPSVVLVGRPNVGKSTLSNYVMGRASSIIADLPGTTRDWVSGLAELPTPLGELAVHWFDTPGLRAATESEAIEGRAVALVRRVLEEADVLIAMRDPRIDWPDAAELPREPDLRVMNKADLLDGAAGARVHPVIATTGDGVADLCAAIANVLGLSADLAGRPWAFSPRLKQSRPEKVSG